MFAKVFEQILDSSIAEDYRVRFVFEDFLKLADKHGVVDMTPQSISRRTNVPLEIVSLGIAELEKPDQTSRTPAEEGRRIIRLDKHRTWGWKIVNYEKYRESATKEMLRMGDSERKAEWRKKKGFSPRPSHTKTEADVEAEQSRIVPNVSETSPGHSWEASEFDIMPALTAHNAMVIPKDFAEMVHQDWATREGKDAAGVKVQFNRYLLKRWQKEGAQWKAGSHRSTSAAAHENGKRARTPNPDPDGWREWIAGNDRITYRPFAEAPPNWRAKFAER